MSAASYILPIASEIDYSNPFEVEGYQCLLYKLYECSGGLCIPRKATRELISIEKELQCWCAAVKNNLMGAPLRYIGMLVDRFAITHRTINGVSPSCNFLRNVRLGAVKRWVNGDKEVSLTDIMQLLKAEVYGDMRSLDSKYCMFYFGQINEWVNELQWKGFFPGIGTAEIYQRLHILMSEDLVGQFGFGPSENQAKHRWASIYKIPDISTLDTPSLKQYIPFALASSRISNLSPALQKEEYIHLFTELASRPDLNPFFREAIHLDLELKRLPMIGA